MAQALQIASVHILHHSYLHYILASLARTVAVRAGGYFTRGVRDDQSPLPSSGLHHMEELL